MPEECQEAKDLKMMLLKGLINQEVLKERERIRLDVLSWLGFWRDKFPPEAVRTLQDIVSPVSSERRLT